MAEATGRQDDDARVARRTLIRGGAVVAGMGLAGALARDAGAQGACEPLLMGCSNQTDQPTFLFYSGGRPGGVSVHSQTASTRAVVGISGPIADDPNDANLGAGVYGLAAGGAGVHGRSAKDVGVLGTSGIVINDPNELQLGAGVYGRATSFGVVGRAASIGVIGTGGVDAFDPNSLNLGAGVYGLSERGVGVVGTIGSIVRDPNDADVGAGVYGFSAQLKAPAVVAQHSSGGVGLRVQGRTILSTAGRDVLPRG
jgi:hypothetical protein